MYSKFWSPAFRLFFRHDSTVPRHPSHPTGHVRHGKNSNLKYQDTTEVYLPRAAPKATRVVNSNEIQLRFISPLTPDTLAFSSYRIFFPLAVSPIHSYRTDHRPRITDHVFIHSRTLELLQSSDWSRDCGTRTCPILTPGCSMLVIGNSVLNIAFRF